MLIYLWVALGGAIGSVGRFWASAAFSRQFGDSFPIGTMVVNVTGSMLIGLAGAAILPEGRWPMGYGFRVFLMAGICGGYTTFSSFSLQTLELLQNREWFFAGLNIMGSVLLCLFGVWIGHLAGVALNQGR